MGIINNSVKSWGILLLRETRWSNLELSGHQDTPGSPPMLIFFTLFKVVRVQLLLTSILF